MSRPSTASASCPAYEGTIVHNGLTPYDRMDETFHAQRSAHPLRYLADVGDTPAFSAWTGEMTVLLLEAKHLAEEALAEGRTTLTAADADRIEGRYHRTFTHASSPCARRPPMRHTGGWTVDQRAAWNLVFRLERDIDQVLAPMDDTAVPVTNDQPERSPRMVEISGTFRSAEHAKTFATARSYLQTAAHS